MKKFPIPAEKILPAASLVGFVVLGLLDGCHSSTASVEASTTRDPVVAPAGTVLRVRLNQMLDTGSSRPGDRFTGALDASVMSGGVEILAKGTIVEGHVLEARESAGPERRAILAVTLDSLDSFGKRVSVDTYTVRRIGARRSGDWTLTGEGPEQRMEAAAGAGKERVIVPADSIIGFTLKSTLSA